ncbi:hypothetical protein BDW22DRAFT_1456030 [Trametopsis cervina]|nr:hypothetical protein BDW22DRAFT_1456030 [Trametopsis cervina]
MPRGFSSTCALSHCALQPRFEAPQPESGCFYLHARKKSAVGDSTTAHVEQELWPQPLSVHNTDIFTSRKIHTTNPTGRPLRCTREPEFMFWAPSFFVRCNSGCVSWMSGAGKLFKHEKLEWEYSFDRRLHSTSPQSFSEDCKENSSGKNDQHPTVPEKAADNSMRTQPSSCESQHPAVQRGNGERGGALTAAGRKRPEGSVR